MHFDIKLDGFIRILAWSFDKLRKSSRFWYGKNMFNWLWRYNWNYFCFFTMEFLAIIAPFKLQWFLYCLRSSMLRSNYFLQRF